MSTVTTPPGPAEQLINRADELKQERSTFDQHMAEIAEKVRPIRLELRAPQVEGAKRMRELFDSTPMVANSNLAAGLYGTFANPADTWFTYAPLDPDLEKSPRVKQWCDAESRRSLLSFGASFSSFYSQITSFFLDYGCFSNAVFSSELKPDNSGFVDVCRPLSECYWDANADGNVDTMFRRWKCPAVRAIQMFGEAISKKTRDRAEKDAKHTIELIHVVLPRNIPLAKELAGDEMGSQHPWVSCYLEVEEKHIISRKGYFEFPYQVARWEVPAGEKYGRFGPGENALADIKSLNVATRDNLRAGNLAGNPPWGAPDEGSINAIRIAPGKVTYGAINPRGQQLLQPLLDRSSVPFSLEMTKELRESVKDAFYFSLMQLVGRTGMTATEVLERQEEKMRLLAPYGGRLHPDCFSPLTLRRFKMLNRLGQTRPAPPELQGRSLQVALTSPFAQAQKSARATSTLRVVQAMPAIAAIDPDVIDRFNGEAALRSIQDGFGAPADLLRDDDATAARRKIRQQTMAAAAAAEIAKSGAGAAKDGAQAMQAMRGQPQAA